MEKRRRLLFHSASHNRQRVPMISELRSPSLKPIKAALGMGLRCYMMNTCASLLFNLQRVPALLTCNLDFLTSTSQSILMLSSLLIFQLYGLHCSKCSYEKYAFNKVTSALLFSSAAAATSHIYYSEIACLWTFSSEIQIHFTWL